ncbi:MAG TPA: SDR family oxidoreductase, partial [Acidimicrobiales bacterium]|nr:SDR family oxidoreductase [Acidimicrobiales bacterium]
PWCVGGERLDSVVVSMAAERSMSPESFLAELTSDTVFKRPTTEDDVANLTLFLCSSAADNITGQDLNVSAGAVMY